MIKSTHIPSVVVERYSSPTGKCLPFSVSEHPISSLSVMHKKGLRNPAREGGRTCEYPRGWFCFLSPGNHENWTISHDSKSYTRDLVLADLVHSFFNMIAEGAGKSKMYVKSHGFFSLCRVWISEELTIWLEIFFSIFFLSWSQGETKASVLFYKNLPHKHQGQESKCKQVLASDHAGNVNPNTKAPLFPKLACLLSTAGIYALQEVGS